jgi:cysteine desulfurase
MSTLIYLDNAATTSLDKQVLEAMLPYMTEHFGNPSSTYSKGRFTRIAVESARKSVAKLLGVSPGTIFFTSGGTESNNTAIAAAIRNLKCTTIITSPIEHHAVLHTVASHSLHTKVPVSFVALNHEGEIDYEDLESQLQKFTSEGHKCLVSLMHANNEIGTILNIKLTAELCNNYNAIFHSDCVQTVGHYPLNLSDIGVHFISGAGHKFHGPKGTGILYVHPSLQIEPLIYGGGQERNMRAGTENVYGIVGFAKALELAMESYEKDSQYIGDLKSYMKQKLQQAIPNVSFNGPEESLYTVLSVCFPTSAEGDSLLMNLDMEGICVSGGSACSSGASYGSHVINALQKSGKCATIRFSFSKYNTVDEIDRVVEVVRAKLQLEEPVLADSK